MISAEHWSDHGKKLGCQKTQRIQLSN